MLRRYTTLVIAGGAGVLIASAVLPGVHWAACVRDPAFWLFAAFVVFGEFRPIRVPGRGGEIAISTTFILALALSYGTGPALVVQACASALADARNRKPLRRTLFNVSQYTLAWAAAGFAVSSLGGFHPNEFALDELAIVGLAAGIFFVINTTLVRTAVAIVEGLRLVDHLRRDLGFRMWTTAMLMGLAPAISAVQKIDLLLVVLITLPVVAIHRAASESARNEFLATHDALTGLANRTLFQERVSGAMADGLRDGVPIAVALMDLDRFKEINDTLGHHHGDALLREVGPRVARAVGDGGFVARLGGDEFAVLLTLEPGDALDIEAAAAKAARAILDVLGEPFRVGGVTLDVGASVGIALHPFHARDVDTLMQRADVAMYRAKEAHTGVEVYAPEQDHHDVGRLAMAGRLKEALEAGQLHLHYQPLLDLHTGRIQSVEALVRWSDPGRGPVSPAEFIPIAERTGLIRPLTSFVLGAALDQCRDWRAEGLDLVVAVNLSTRTLLDTSLPDEVATALAERGLPASSLVLEITESVIMSDLDRAMGVLRALHAMGVKLAVDDFGTGYSSLAYLKRLPVDEVKIDRSFVSTMAEDASDAVIVRAITELGRSLGLAVVAEGVEDADTLERLRAMGCDIAQGYHVSRPVPAREIAERCRAEEVPFVVELAQARRARDAGTGAGAGARSASGARPVG